MPGGFGGGERFKLAFVYGLDFADCVHGGVMLLVTLERLWERYSGSPWMLKIFWLQGLGFRAWQPGNCRLTRSSGSLPSRIPAKNSVHQILVQTAMHFNQIEYACAHWMGSAILSMTPRILEPQRIVLGPENGAMRVSCLRCIAPSAKIPLLP